VTKKNLNWLFLLAGILLFAQTAIIFHYVQHPFHADSAICEIYSVAQNDSENGLPSTNALVKFLGRETVHSIALYAVLKAFPSLGFSIRAPPVLL